MKKYELIDLMEQHAGRITMSTALDAGYPRSLLKLLEDEGSVVCESRGVYALVSVPVDDFAVIALRWPKVVFSHGSALWLLGLSDRVPQIFELACPQGYHAPALLEEFPGTKMRGVAQGRFELGITQVSTPTGTLARVYNAERCICDLLRDWRGRKVDLQLFNNTLHSYMKSDNKDLQKLARYAEQLGVTKPLRDVMEVIA